MSEIYGTAAETLNVGSLSSRATGPKRPLDADAVRTAYRRWAGLYDAGFGLVSGHARRAAVLAVNAAPGVKVLEVGVGTGLALPLYAPQKRVTGIDLSADMLRQARGRVADSNLGNIEALLEMDAQATSFEAGQFDIAVAMFVASVVPNPQALVAELKRVVRPGGTILFVNHFAAERGPVWWVERAMAPASSLLGWHPDFHLNHMFAETDLKSATIQSMRPMGLFRLIQLKN
ncbi:MAG: class I SAM-dependent methyltransferase [Acidocella sp.]|nr:class I SAM-dependent methyltransferase [Acidocella sp.]